ncbi:radical SAM superfamily enzyme YgiQ (UPF0313 family) [Anaerobacterium chartisolvens]|uniref:Radical SAM superfamily enzyme YgiQ (UPF0313 family) n=1 Tax=Anaerobacterium chartisolvens TaxID=1297424 RepID=A0A369B4U6_9FIRM|nr:radical SAM protein [Anaerobacterium chartisolvens]RCX16325.1 radical SAM superfamily enzyme YgiQ (UPF0313 family) [Anaerobacterium chartisolvens]
MNYKSKSLLINYVSVPELLSCLIPDIGLALLAGALKKEDHLTKILDYSTLETIKRFCPSKHLQEEFREISGDLENYFQESKFIDSDLLNNFDLSRYKGLLEKEKEEKSREIKKIINEIDKEIQVMKPDFIGFKLWSGECFIETVEIAEEIKKRYPNLRIIGGGPQVDWSQEHIYDVTDVFDVLAFGDGDETIIEVAEYCIGERDIEIIPNILYKKDGKVCFNDSRMVKDLDKLPLPDYSYETYPALKANNKLKVFMLEESRGCPHTCNFCIHPIKSGDRWRIKKPERIISEIENIINTHNSRYFRFSGSNTPNLLQTQIAQEIIKRNIKVRYSSFGHINAYRNCDYSLMRAAGCESLLFGLETGNYGLQKDVINKVIKVEDAEKVLNDCKRSGIKTVVSVIYPNPKETEETRKETLEYLRKIKPDGAFICMPFIVPRTSWFIDSDKYGIDIPSKEKHIRFMMTYHVRYNGHPILWNFGSHKINNLDFRQQGLECGRFVDDIKKIGLATQVTEEEMLFASIVKEDFMDFALKYQRIRNNCDMEGLEKLITNLNENVCNVSN